MDLVDSRTERFCVHTALELSVKDFRTTTKQVSITSMELSNSRHDFDISFFASAIPNRKSKIDKDWLVVYVKETVHEGFLIPNNSVLSWIVSIIDNEGTSRLPRSFRKSHFHSYLESSIILNQADEFLSKGVLTLRFDIYFSWNGLLISFDPLLRYHPMQRGSNCLLHDFYRSIPQAVCFTNGNETGCESGAFTVYDFTSRILSLPQFHEKRKTFGVYGIPPCTFPWLSSESKEEFTDNLEHIWVFDTYPDKFILSLEERQENVGALLLKTSSFIRRCINVPMKEQREKRIDFSNVDSETFKILLFFLETGTLPDPRIRESMKLYIFSHLYQMETLQRKCADQMGRTSRSPELQKIANFYSDEYFLTQLFSQLYEYQNENSILKGSEMDVKADSDCYI